MNDDSSMQMVWGAVRTLLAFAAGIFTAKGLLPTDQANELVGASMVLIPFVWSLVQKKWSEQNTKVRETVAVQAGVIASRAGAAPALVSHIDKVDAQEIIAAHAPGTS